MKRSHTYKPGRPRRQARFAVGATVLLTAGLTAAPAHADTTYSEQVGRYGVNTFTNYHNASGMGPHIDAYSTVQVSCKVYDPYIVSANPDGYWYRIASSPWNNAYYSPANTFYNGDPVGGPYTHNTDFNVPDCGSMATSPTPPPTSTPPAPAPPANAPSADIAFPVQVPAQPLPLKAYNNSLLAHLQGRPAQNAMLALLSSCQVARFYNCGALGKHYLDRSGTPYYINLASLLQAQPDVASLYQYWLRDNAQKAVAALSGTASSQAQTMSFDTSGDTASTSWTDIQRPYVPHSDWDFALHNYSVRERGDVWVGAVDASGDRPLQIRYRAFAYDVYDLAGIFALEGRLATLGWAAQFAVRGESPVQTIRTSLRAFNSNNLVFSPS